ncbi:hypothetical protein ACGI86_000683 [Serratia marcescens]
MDRISKSCFTALLILLLICLSLIAHFGDDDGYFVGNLVPEFIGVCVDLIIILKVFEVWQQRDERRKLIKVERRLREFLIFFLNHTCEDFPEKSRPGRFYGTDYEQNQKSLTTLISYIKERGMNEENVLKIQAYCKSQHDIINNMIPVSS